MEYKIYAVLNHGKIVSHKILVIFYILLSILLLLPIITLLAIIIICMGVMEADTSTIIGLTFGNVFCISVCIFILFGILHQRNLKRNIKLWSEDSIQTKAYLKRLNTHSLNFKPDQMELLFNIDGKDYSKISKKAGILYDYNKVFLKFDSQCVDILYSPKYDEVMFLKDNSNRIE